MLNATRRLIRRPLASWIARVERHPVFTLVVSILVTAALSAYAIANLSINTDTADMIDRNLPFHKVDDEIKRLFPQLADPLILIVDGETPETAEAAAEELAALLKADTEHFTDVFAPGVHPFFKSNGLLFLKEDELANLETRLAEVEPLLATLNGDPTVRGFFDVLGLAMDNALETGSPPAGLAETFDALSPVIEARIEGRPRYLSWTELIGSTPDDVDSRRQIILAQPILDYSSLSPAREALDALAALIAETDLSVHDGVSVGVTGTTALKEDELRSVTEGAATAGLLSLLLVSILLFAGLGSWRLILAALVSLLMGLVWTTAFAVAAIGYFNLISIAFAVLFIGLGVDYGIHVALRYKEEVQKGHSSQEALRVGTARLAGPLILAAATNMVAFYAFIPTAYAGLAQLGLISGTGILFALVASWTILPAILTLLPLKPGPNVTRGPLAIIEPYIRRHARGVVILSGVLGIGALALVPQARFELDRLKLMDQTTPSLVAFKDLLSSSRTTPYTVEGLARTRVEAEEMAERLTRLKTVDQVVTVFDFVPAAQDEKLDIIDRMSLFLMPVFMNTEVAPPPTVAEQIAAMEETRARLALLTEAAWARDLAPAASRLDAAISGFLDRARNDEAAFAGLEESVFRFLPRQIEKLDLALIAAPVALDDLPRELRERYLAEDGSLRVVVFPADNMADEAALRRFSESVLGVVPALTGLPVLQYESGNAVTSSIATATTIAAVLITFLLALVLRRPRDVLFVLYPLGLAAICTVASTVVLDTPFNFANIIVLPLLIGLGVDSGIHITMRARDEERDGWLSDTSTPRAVFYSKLTTLASFGTLALSGHRGTASMGALLFIAIAWTFAAMLIILPALMTWNRQRETARMESLAGQ